MENLLLYLSTQEEPGTMLWKLLVALWAFLTPHAVREEAGLPELSPAAFEPLPFGPQSAEEEAIAHAALHGDHFGGDMILPENFTEDAGIRNERFRWPGYPGRAVIPYVIDNSLARIRPLILQGMEHYHRQTCIRFVPRTTERDYVRLFFGNGCWSMIGRNGGRQDLSLGQGCHYVGLVIHELGHAVGLFHEHQRSDRDRYLNVFLNNVVNGQQHNFIKSNPNDELIFTSYDYDSIMHYGSYAFSRVPNRLPTMQAKNGHQLREPYAKSGFTQSDLVTLKKLYRC